MADKTKVNAGKPATGGAMSVAPVSTTLPTTANADLDQAFKNLGYISEDGLTNETSRDTENIKSWGGATVLAVQTEFNDTFGCTLIETTNIDVLKLVFGASNVSGALATGITINVNSDELTENAFVIDMILNGALKRVVIPKGKITEIGEVSYTDSDAIGYEITITAMPDASGNTHYEYILQN